MYSQTCWSSGEQSLHFLLAELFSDFSNSLAGLRSRQRRHPVVSGRPARMREAERLPRLSVLDNAILDLFLAGVKGSSGAWARICPGGFRFAVALSLALPLSFALAFAFTLALTAFLPLALTLSLASPLPHPCLRPCLRPTAFHCLPFTFALALTFSLPFALSSFAFTFTFALALPFSFTLPFPYPLTLAFALILSVALAFTLLAFLAAALGVALAGLPCRTVPLLGTSPIASATLLGRFSFDSGLNFFRSLGPVLPAIRVEFRRSL